MILILASAGDRSMTSVTVDREMIEDISSSFSRRKSSRILIGTIISEGPPGVNVYNMS